MVKKKLKAKGPLSGSASSSSPELESRLKALETTGLIEIGRRIAEVRGDKSRPEFAKIVNVHKNTLARCELGKREPSMHLLLAMNYLFGINPGWVILGPKEGGMKRVYEIQDEKGSYARVAPLDRPVLLAVLQVVEEIMAEANGHLAPEKKAELILLLYEEARDREGKVDRARVLQLVKLAS